MQNRKHWTALAGYGKCKMKNAKKNLKKVLDKRLSDVIKLTSCRLKVIDKITKAKQKKIKKLLTNDKRCDNLLKLSLETTTKQRTLITKQ